MIHLFIRNLRQRNVEYIVAPYESDAQLAYLYKQKCIDFVITEDSDLLPYGVQRVFFKMDPQGNGIEIDLANLGKCQDYALAGGKQFTQEMLLHLCIISGCDYHAGVPSVGCKRALQLFREHGGDIKAVISQLERQGKISDIHTYMKDHLRAEMTFKHQIVYDMIERKERYLTNLPT